MPFASIAAAVLALVAALAIAEGDGWRTAGLALCASGALAVTRVRYMTYVAVALLVVVAILASAGGAPTQDERPPPQRGELPR